MDRLVGLLGIKNGSRKDEANSGEPSREPKVNFHERPNRSRTYGSTIGRGNSAKPQSIIGRRAKTSDKVQLAKDQPHTNDRHNMNVLLEDMIPRIGIMRIKEEIISAIRTGRRNRRLYQRERTLWRIVQRMQHQWARPLNL